ncbi:hypothetical protein MMC11_004695 [Xylographa trunciseda]|nr:hypothetical protein [Xylographa trunciseda]
MEEQQVKVERGEVVARLPSNDAVLLQTSDTAAGTLSQRCYKYSTELDRLRLEALEGAQISALAKALLNPAASRLQNIRVRLDIWLSDVEVGDGSLEETDTFKKSRLYRVIFRAFAQMQENVEEIARDIVVIKDEARLMVAQSQSDVSTATDAAGRVARSADSLNIVLKNLISLATSVQMFRAVQANQGPYAAVQTQKSTVKKLTSQETGKEYQEVPMLSRSDDDEDQCAYCNRWFQRVKLEAHLRTCLQQISGRVDEQLSPSEPGPSQSNPEDPKPSQTSLPSPINPPVYKPMPGDIDTLSERPPRDPEPKSTTIPLENAHYDDALPSRAESTTKNLFEDFDDMNSLRKLEDLISRFKATNFIVRPDIGRTTIAINVPNDLNTWSEIVKDLRESTKTVWVHIWVPDRQLEAPEASEALAQIAKQYSFSSEISSTLQSFPSRYHKLTHVSSGVPRTSDITGTYPREDKKAQHRKMATYDIELGTLKKSSEDDIALYHVHNESGSIYHNKLIVDRNSVCVEYYLLRPRPFSKEATSSESRQRPWTGTWSCLLQCKNLVLSLRETSLAPTLQKLQTIARSTVLNDHDYLLGTLASVSLPGREPLPGWEREGVPTHFRRDKLRRDTSRLFHLLFKEGLGDEDPFSQNLPNYAVILEYIKEEIIRQPSERHAEVLFHTTRQLSELERFYKSRMTLISELLHPSIGRLQVEDGLTYRPVNEVFEIPQNTRILFSRVEDDIKCRILIEIESLMDEANAQRRLLRQIATIRQAQDLQLLRMQLGTFSITPSIIVILLLLILMTGYFSTSIDDLQGIYSVTTYWVTFTIVLSASLLLWLYLRVVCEVLQKRGYPNYLSPSYFANIILHSMERYKLKRA